MRRDFSDLMYSSVEALKQKLRKKSDRKRFIQDIVRQYRIRKVETMRIRKIMDTLCENEEWGFQRYRGLFFILRTYVNKETIKLRDKYKDLVTGWYEVRSLSDRYKRIIRKKNDHEFKVRYKVPPRTICAIKRLWRDISDRFNLPPLEALLYDKRYSSLILTWLIYAGEETSALIRNLLIENMPANIPFLEENNITHIIYDFEVLYPVSSVSMFMCKSSFVTIFSLAENRRDTRFVWYSEVALYISLSLSFSFLFLFLILHTHTHTHLQIPMGQSCCS